MRKFREPYTWGKNEESKYDINDFRSKFYKGDWIKAWLDYVSEEAIVSESNIYELMWERSSDKKEHMPLKLYKFYPFNENSIKCIEQNKVYLNTPEYFNDPFDCAICTNELEFEKEYLLDYIKRTGAIERNVLTQQEKNKIDRSICVDQDEHRGSPYILFDSVVFHIYYNEGNYNEKAEELLKVCAEAREVFKRSLKTLREQKIRVTSFSDLKKEQLQTHMEMWAHYGQQHCGFCVEYDLSASIDDEIIAQIVQGSLFLCKYSARPIRMSKRNFYKYALGKALTVHQKLQFEKSIIMSFLTKSSAWSYEKEWRMILPNDVSVFYDNMVPFYPIKTIYLGCKMPTDNREYMYRLAREKGIEVVNMEQYCNEFKLKECYVDIDHYFNEKKCYKQKSMNNGKYELLKKDIYEYIKDWR